MRTVIGSFFAIVAAMVVATSAFAQSSYQIKPGDALAVEVLEDPNLNRTVLVLPDGSITFPLVGSLRAAGKSVDALRSSLSSALATNFNAPPTVYVSVASIAPPPFGAAFPGGAPLGPTIDIYVTGEVGVPGKIAASEGTTILQALAEAGGLTRFAARKRIELRRADTRYLYNYDGTGGSIKGSTILRPGDVIVVPARRLFE
ncbi:polysaccharide export protein [Ruegeria sediminis]|uniref:Polysaccharide export protein n=2 Tax=Ruegeria sediminis TaxID=2583820 RepID=A0ABY2WX07_9RHOB|nr:polysaccharide export protein [Ruegeria sediminis]